MNFLPTVDVLENVVSGIAPMLIDVAGKSFLLLAATGVVAFLLRKQSAATVHRLWTLGFLACVFVPVVSLVSPTWNLAVLPVAELQAKPPAAGLVVNSSVPMKSRVTNLATSPRVIGEGEKSGSALAVTSSLTSSSAESTRATDLLPPLTNNTAQAEKLDMPLLVFVGLAFWSSVVLVCLLRIVWHQFLLSRLIGRCEDLDSKRWTSAAADASTSLGLSRRTRLLKLEEAVSPMLTGMLQPVVVLPGDAEGWLPAQRRSVLLHELAHAKRYDVLTQMIANWVCALHWFNPIAWVGLWQMRKLRELACDDLVVASGQQPADYAEVLLEVARSYRHRNLATAVGMARRANVENRILAILDRARSHVSVSRRVARVLFALAAVLAVVIGSVRLESQAKPQAAALESEDGALSIEKKVEGDDDLRSMEIHILDEQGSPLEGANLYANAVRPKDVEGDRIVNRDLVADDEGNITLSIDRKKDTVKLWAWAPGKVAEFVWLNRGPEQPDALLPRDYEFRLAKGTAIGGIVVDQDGEPIARVHVRVQAEVKETLLNRPSVNAKSIVSNWLTDSFDQPTIKTDAQGRWRLENAPGPMDGRDCEFSIKLDHPDYSSDSRWGGLQRTQGVTTEKLRSGDAKIVMSRGTHVEGTVVDSEGKPVTKGWVVWHDEPYFTQGVWEAGLDLQGSFETPQLAPGEHPITIIAPGYAAQRRVVKIEHGMAPLRFELNPGKRIEIRIVDVQGTPIPKAGVYLGSASDSGTWNGTNALHNQGGSGVPEYGISRRADDNGVYIWDWAPEEPVRYSVGAKGFASQAVSLVAKSEPHIITMANARVVAGLVTDVTTGEPIKKFQAMPVIVFGPNHYSTRLTNTIMGRDGRYELPLRGSGDSEDRYRVRIEAEGYRSVVSKESYGPQDGRVELNVRLELAPARKGRVIDTNSKPVSGVTVIEGTPTWVPSVRNGEPDSYGQRIVRTDSDGRFAFHATTDPVLVLVLHDAGVSEKLVVPEDDSIGDLQLQPWAHVSGRLIQDGKPISDETLSFYPVLKGHLGEPRFQDSYYTKTDAEGHFEFERLPPIAGSLKAHLGPWQDSPLTSSHTLALDLQPGEHKQIELGGEGIAVTGKVVATGRDDAELSKQWSLNYLISRDRGIKLPVGFPELSFDPTGPVQAAWFLEPKHYDWLATRENYFVKLQSDGQLRISGVSAGTYDLVLRLYEQPAGCLVETIGEKVVTIEVTEADSAQGSKDIGTIEVECRAGPRVGENMQAYNFTDPSGRQRTIQEMKGRYVLMHVWASWCGPCIENMPSLRATVEELSDRPVTFVGLNVDKDAARARELVKSGGWDWSQNYLGDTSDVARQLAISSVPTYYLVGPDGLLVASATDWSEIRGKLSDLLGEGAR